MNLQSDFYNQRTYKIINEYDEGEKWELLFHRWLSIRGERLKRDCLELRCLKINLRNYKRGGKTQGTITRCIREEMIYLFIL